jgi:hypothetical protein
MPMRLRFRELPAQALPQSHADLQQENGCAALADPHFVTRVIARWRGAAEKPQAAAPAVNQTVPLWSAAS